MHTYLMVCITKHLGLLIGGDRVDRVVVFRIDDIWLSGLVFLVIQLMIQGSMVRVG